MLRVSCHGRQQLAGALPTVAARLSCCLPAAAAAPVGDAPAAAAAATAGTPLQAAALTARQPAVLVARQAPPQAVAVAEGAAAVARAHPSPHILAGGVSVSGRGRQGMAVSGVAGGVLRAVGAAVTAGIAGAIVNACIFQAAQAGFIGGKGRSFEEGAVLPEDGCQVLQPDASRDAIAEERPERHL